MVQEATKPPAPPNTVTLTINDREVTVAKGTLLVEAAKAAGIDIPVFCYEPRLASVGACRMCLVEIEKMPRLQTACTTPVADGMIVRTNSAKPRAAQSDVLGMLLANHPLDCPVCDKGGECPLQDTTFNYGPGVSKFIEPKRTYLKPIPLSPVIALDRERCIMCYRCVRFQHEIPGDDALTVIDRGSHSEIAVTEDREFDSPFSGNTIELCPVGALTSIPFRFRARPWDLTKIHSVCDKCSVGCNLNIEYRNNTVLRLTAHANPPVDDGWLCDHGRFTYEYVNSKERLKQPLIRRDGELQAASWDEALNYVAQQLRERAPQVSGVISTRAMNEELYLFAKLFRVGLQSSNVTTSPQTRPVIGPFGMDALHGSIVALEQMKVILLLGVDPLHNQPVLHLRLRKAVKHGAKLVVVTPEPNDLDAVATHSLRVPQSALADLATAWAHLLVSEEAFNQEFVQSRTSGLEALRPTLAEGTLEQAAVATGVSVAELTTIGRALAGDGPTAVLFHRDPDPAGDHTAYITAINNLGLLLAATREDGIFGALVEGANEQGALDLGVAGPSSGQGGARYLLGVDPVGAGETLPPTDFMVVQDLTLTATAAQADVVLPAVSWAEKDGTFTNLERRVQRLRPAVHPPGDARPDWRVLKALGQRLAPDAFRFTSPGTIWQELAAMVPAYGQLNYSILGAGGQQWSLPTVGDGNGGGRFAFRSRATAEGDER